MESPERHLWIAAARSGYKDLVPVLHGTTAPATPGRRDNRQRTRLLTGGPAMARQAHQGQLRNAAPAATKGPAAYQGGIQTSPAGREEIRPAYLRFCGAGIGHGGEKAGHIGSDVGPGGFSRWAHQIGRWFAGEGKGHGSHEQARKADSRTGAETFSHIACNRICRKAGGIGEERLRFGLQPRGTERCFAPRSPAYRRRVDGRKGHSDDRDCAISRAFGFANYGTCICPIFSRLSAGRAVGAGVTTLAANLCADTAMPCTDTANNGSANVKFVCYRLMRTTFGAQLQNAGNVAVTKFRERMFVAVCTTGEILCVFFVRSNAKIFPTIIKRVAIDVIYHHTLRSHNVGNQPVHLDPRNWLSQKNTSCRARAGILIFFSDVRNVPIRTCQERQNIVINQDFAACYLKSASHNLFIAQLNRGRKTGRFRSDGPNGPKFHGLFRVKQSRSACVYYSISVHWRVGIVFTRRGAQVQILSRPPFSSITYSVGRQFPYVHLNQGDIMTNDEIDRFWGYVNKSGDCWLWTAGCFKRGYGAFAYDGKRPGYAHRFSYELHFGPIPEGKVIMHKCDNRKCVNPAHLKAGTQRDNIHDAMAKNRWMTKARENYLSAQPGSMAHRYQKR